MEPPGFPPPRFYVDASYGNGVNVQSTEKQFQHYVWMFIASLAGAILFALLLLISTASGDNGTAVVFGLMLLVIRLPVCGFIIAACVDAYHFAVPLLETNS